jgi:hypothetical protein
MGHHLAIFSRLEHDGDGLVRYRIAAESGDFRGETELWGGEGDVKELAALLRGFPSAIDSSAEYSFGSPGTGTVALRFEATDPLGHCRVWVSMVSAYSVGRTDEFESAHICISFAPAAVDRFCQELEMFAPQHQNQAELNGHAA